MKKKNEYKKAKNKATILMIVIFTLLFIGSIALGFISSFFNNTKRGIEISEKIGFSLIIKICFSVIAILLALIKAKNYSWSNKVFFIAYAITYWIGLLILPFKYRLLILNIFVIIFLVIGIYYMIKQTKITNEESLNRFLGFGGILAIVFVLEVSDLGLPDNLFEKVLLICVIISALIAIIGFVILFKNYKSQKSDNSNRKKQIGNLIALPLCILMFGTLLLSFEAEAINYIFDYSEETIYNCEIIELEEKDKFTSAKAIIFIDNQEIAIALTQKKYLDYKIGNYIKVSKYNGLFGLNYYLLVNDE